MSRTRDLSDDTQTRIQQLVENSAPNPDRPKLSEAIEKELEGVERKAAALMATKENESYKFKHACKELLNEIELLRQRIRAKFGNGSNGSGQR